MITLFQVRKHQYSEDLYDLIYIKGDVDLSSFANKLRYSVVGTREVYKLAVKLNEIYNDSSNIFAYSSNDDKCSLIKETLSPKVQNGYWFDLKVEEIVIGATNYRDQYGIAETKVESIGFGDSEEEAKKDAIKRALRKLSFVYQKGLVSFDTKDSNIPYYDNITYVSGKELRKYIVDNYVNPNQQEAPKHNNKPQENINNSAEHKALIEEISKLNQENIKLKGENASLTEEKKVLQGKLQELENKLANIKQALSFLKGI